MDSAAGPRRAGGASPPEWTRLGGALPPPRDDADGSDLVWQELVAYFRWYDRAARRHRWGHLSLRLLVLVLAAAVAVLAGSGAAPRLTAALAALIVAVEGAQQLFQLHANWLRYRLSAETLRRHAFQYAAGVAPYDGNDRRALLARALQDVTGREGTGWSDTMQRAGGDGATS